MNSIRFTYKQIKSRPLSSALHILLFATGVGIISFVFLLKNSFETLADKNAGGIDLVVGAKGSPLQLILSGLYQIDYPTGNIDYAEAMALSSHPLIKQAIPLALGDNYDGFRIVGATPDYPAVYRGELKTGALWQKDFEVTIGSEVAARTGLAPGDSFAGIHGLAAETDHAHEDMPYTVAGVFKETSTTLDRLILTSIESVWELHEEHEHAEEHAEGEAHEDEPREITTLLIRYQNPMGAITLPRLVNKTTNMQAASPAQEINRLYALLGIGVEALSFISGFIIFISALSIFISLLNSLKERSYELALIRVMGGSRRRLFSGVMLEGISYAIPGYLAGFALSRLALLLLSAYAGGALNYTLPAWIVPADLYLLAASLLTGAAAALFPAVKAMNAHISKILNQ
jgi:putative ABC transport system permease protein